MTARGDNRPWEWWWPAAAAALFIVVYAIADQIGPIAALLGVFRAVDAPVINYFWRDRENLYLPDHGVRVALFLYPAAFAAAAAAAPWLGRIPASIFTPWVKGRRKYLWLYGVALAALLAVAWFVFGGEPHEFDETAYILQARIFSHGRLWADRPPTDVYPGDEGAELDNFFVGLSRLEVLNGSKWFTIYAPLHPLLLALGYVVRLPWLMTPGAAAFVPPLLVALALRVDARAAPWAAALSLTSPFWLFNGASFMSEGTWLPLFALFLLLYFRALEKRTRGAFFAAGLVLGLAALNREWTTLISSLPVLGHAVWQSVKKGRSAKPAAWIAAGVAPAVVAYYAYNVALTADFLKLVRSYSRQEHFGFNDVHTFAEAVNWAARNLYVMSSDLFGWPLLSLAPLALYPFLKRPLPLFAKLTYATLASAFIGNFFIQNAGVIYGPRYYIGVYPGAVVLSAAALAALPAGLRKLRPTVSDASARGFVLGGFAALLFINGAAYLPFGVCKHEGFPFKYQPWATKQLKEALAVAGVTRAVVFVAPRERYRGPMPNDPTFNDDVIYARHQVWRDDEAMRFLPGRRYFICDYETFERDGVLVEVEPSGGTGAKDP